MTCATFGNRASGPIRPALCCHNECRK